MKKILQSVRYSKTQFETMQISIDDSSDQQPHNTRNHNPSRYAKSKLFAIPQLIQSVDPKQQVKGDTNHED